MIRSIQSMTAALLCAVLVASPALAQSTINTAQPASSSNLTSLAVRQQFQAAASDINGLLSKHAATSVGQCPSTPYVGEDCLTIGSTPYGWNIWSGGTGGWVQFATINRSTGVVALALNAGEITGSNPIVVGFPGGVATVALNFNSSLLMDGSNNLSLNLGNANTWTATQTFPAASIPNSELANSTISGTALGGTLPSLTFGTHLTGTSYNGSGAITLGTDAASANTASTIVARDGSGNFAAGTITAALTGHASLDLALGGGTMSGSIAMGSNAITGLTTLNGNTISTGTGTLSLGSFTETLGGNLVTSGAVTHAGAFSTTITATAATNSTLPAGTHTLAMIDAGQTFAGTNTFSGQIASTLPTGTAPFSVASTTNVPNLNASSINGATFAAPGAIGSGTAGSGAFSTLSASGTVSGAGFAAYLASPPAIGGTAAAAGAFTTLAATTYSGLPTATNAALGTMRGDGATINCVVGVCAAIGGSATAVTPLTTTVTGGAPGSPLTSTNAGCSGTTPCLINVASCLNILAFGGNSNGTTANDTAFNGAYSALGTNGGCIYFPAGKYSFTSAISKTFPNSKYSVSIVGDGSNLTTLYWPNASGGIALAAANNNNSFAFHHLHCTTAQANSGTCINATGINNMSSAPPSLIEDVLCTGDDFTGLAGSDYWATCFNLSNWGNITVRDSNAYGSLSTGAGVCLAYGGNASASSYATILNVFGGSYNFCSPGIQLGPFWQGVTIANINCNGGTLGNRCIYQPAGQGGTAALLQITGIQSNVGGNQIDLQTGVDNLTINNNPGIYCSTNSCQAINIVNGGIFTQILGNLFSTFGTLTGTTAIVYTNNSLGIIANNIINAYSTGIFSTSSSTFYVVGMNLYPNTTTPTAISSGTTSVGNVSLGGAMSVTK